MAKKKKQQKKAGKIIKITEREIFKFLKANPQHAFNHKQIAAGADLKGLVSGQKLVKILENLVKIRKLEKIGRSKYKVPGKALSYDGILDMARDGFGFVRIEGQDGNDIFIPAEGLHTALPGDKVKVTVTRVRSRDKLREGIITEVLQRARSQYVGTIDHSDDTIWFVADDPKIPLDFLVDPKHLNGAKHGQKVLIEILDWNDDLPAVKVVRILGNPGENQAEMHAILYQYGFVPEFPPDVEQEAEAIQVEITEEEISRRRDMRGITTFTIDPEDAKDFDDALSFRELDKGIYEIGIHIADVTHYVVPGTRLDEEAKERATSVYLVDRTVPMLPEVLSNNLCSLRPEEEKLAFSAIFEMNEQGAILNEWYGRTVILSDKRFTYEEAQKVLDMREGPFAYELIKLNEIAHILRKKRFASGSIFFEEDEVKFKLDDEGKPLSVYKKIRKDAHKLIEDFMLLANRKVTEYVHKLRKDPPLNFVFRIHDRPDEEKLTKLKSFVQNFGYDLQLGSLNSITESMNQLLVGAEGKPEQNIISSVAIRTMSKAIYSTKNIGHYGLGFKHYTHFTSPIRRYPDMMVHRLLAGYLEGNFRSNINQLDKDCEHSSLMEKKATEAERSSVKYKQVEFLEDKIGVEFEALVSGVTNWGIYAEITENKCEGMIAMAELQGDYYDFDADNYCVRGRHSGHEIHLGDKVVVKVKETNLHRKTIDFELVEHLDNPFQDPSLTAPKQK